MIRIVRSSAALALASGLLMAGCALDVAAGTSAPETDITTDTAQQLRGHRRPYHLVRVDEYRGESTTSSGSARWYMPSVIEDQDGDGENDLLLGQPYGHGADPTRQGAVRILSGVDLHVLRTISPGDVDNELEGTFGYAAHSLGDINHDGRTDLAIGSPVIRGRNPADGTLDPAGYQNTGVTWLLNSRSDGGFSAERILGDDPSGFFGYWMAPISIDLPRFLRHGPPRASRGPHLPILGLASAQARFRAGRVWGIEPRTASVVYRASDDPANNDAISERRAYFIASVADLDGNGVTDVLSTANGQWLAADPAPRRYAGRIYLNDGLTGRLIRVIEGASDTQQLGYRTAARQIDDIDGAGVDDLLVGSAQDAAASGVAQGGVAYVISGRAIRASRDKVLKISEHPEIVLRTHTGTQGGELLGDNMTNLFDLDGDGVDEYAISAFGNVSSVPGTGAVIIYSGRTGAERQRLEGESANLFFGQQTVADRANGTLYVVDVYFPDPVTGKSIGRVVLFRAEPDEA
jgi:hypothetical protein